MDSEQHFLQEILDDLEHNRLKLPTLPEVALRVRDAVSDENASAPKVAEIVATDAALSARLLQVANSPLYRGRAPIDNIKMAITRMGFAQVRNLVTSLVMKQMFQATSGTLDTRLRMLWEHSVSVASISAVLSAQIDGLQKDQGMLAGLIHDIGALPILMRAEDTPELVNDEALLDRVVTTLHPQLGEKILASWGFPQTLVDVAAQHENLERDVAGPADYVDVVMVANLQSHFGTDHPCASVDWNTVAAFARVGIEPDVSVVDIEENQDAIEEIEHILIEAPVAA